MHKVLIRPLRIEDAKTSYKWRNDSEIWKYTGNKPDKTITPEIETEWLQKALTDKTTSRFAILVDDQYIGNIQLTNIENNSAQYHIFIGEKQYWGKGVAKLATAQILRYAQNELKLSNVYLKVNPLNIGAIKLYEKCGFVEIDEEITLAIDLNKAPLPMVSVFMITYNHDKFIAQAIESILDQKTSFDFDIVIGEDCSTDNTREIILNYYHLYPGKFKLLLHIPNIGAMENMLQTLENCSGKYIAMLEGDDYWTDPNKLQKQFNFLEKNEKYSLVCHRYSIIKIPTLEILPDYEHDSFNDKIDGIEIDLNVFFEKWLTKTMTVMFRNNIIEFEQFKRYKYFRDVHLFYHLIKNNKGYCTNENMAVYQMHAGGIHSSNNNFLSRLKIAINIYEEIAKTNKKNNDSGQEFPELKKAIKKNLSVWHLGNPFFFIHAGFYKYLIEYILNFKDYSATLKIPVTNFVGLIKRAKIKLTKQTNWNQLLFTK